MQTHQPFKLLLSLTLLFIISGCDPVFEPLKENDLYHYSLNGLLDASADTHSPIDGCPSVP